MDEKRDRTKQVQFRMPNKLHLELRKALLDNGMSMADLFNETATKYVKNYKQRKGEENNG